jgi:hypothetical protein
MSDNNLTPDGLAIFLKTSGFEIGSTGGGCTAWMLSLTGANPPRAGDVYLMITNDSDHDFGSERDVAENGIYVGVHDDLGEVWQGIAMNCDAVPLLVAQALQSTLSKGDNQ